MTRTTFPFVANDVSTLARSLGRELAKADALPGHLQLLNMLARATGYQNFQHFRAQTEAQDRLEQPAPAEPIDHRKVERVLKLFDPQGRLTRWPSKAGQRELCLWALWSVLPAAEVLSEKQVNAALNAHHHFGDAALLRREMFERRMLTRKPDGSDYQRIEQRPPVDAVALIRHLGKRRG